MCQNGWDSNFMIMMVYSQNSVPPSISAGSVRIQDHADNFLCISSCFLHPIFSPLPQKLFGSTLDDKIAKQSSFKHLNQMVNFSQHDFLFCLKLTHTTQNGQNKWTKILTLETTIFGLIMMHSAYRQNIKCQKCAGMGLKGFHI